MQFFSINARIIKLTEYVQKACFFRFCYDLNPQFLFKRLLSLADFFNEVALYEEALPLYKKALAILEKSLGSEHPHTKTVAGNYAVLLEKMSES
jgi:hypothetical protein